MREVIHKMGALEKTSVFLVVHGPAWMLETFSTRLQKETTMTVRLAEEGMETRAGEMYLAPGDRHMVVESGSLRIRLNMDAPENYMRPAADPLFRSAAAAFGRHCIAVVLTGMGRDGTLGAATIAAAGGKVIAQDPRTAVASSMPQTVVNIGAASSVVPLDALGEALRTQVLALAAEL